MRRLKKYFKQLNYCNNNFEIDKKNKYIWISQTWVALEVKAWIETTNTKNEETIKNDILRAINKLDNDLLWVAKRDLLEKMNYLWS